MKNASEGMHDLEQHTKKIIMGNRKEIYSTHTGTFTGLISQVDGTTSVVMLKDTYLVPDLWVNLFSLTKALTKEDTQLSNEEEFIKVTSEDYSIKFDRKFSYGRGHLLAVDMIPKVKTKPEADTMFENLIIKNTIWKDEGMHKEYDNVGIGEKENFNQLWITHLEVTKEDIGNRKGGSGTCSSQQRSSQISRSYEVHQGF